MRVLFVIDSLVPGGAERSTVAMVPYLMERSIQPEVAVLHDRPGLHDEVRSHGVPIHDLSGGTGRFGWIRRTHALLGAERFDVVHTSLFEADVAGRVAGRARGVPVVSTLATARYGATHLADPNLHRSKVRAGQVVDVATARLTTRLHAVSEYVADAMADRLRYPRERIDVVPRGRPAELAAPRSAQERIDTRRRLGLCDQPLALVVARHDHVKGIDRVIQAFAQTTNRVDDAVLLIAGRDGNQTALLHSLVDDLGIGGSVRFLGARDDVGALLHAADAFVLGSRREGHPGSLLEAMAVGTPAVVHDMAQTREVVTAEQAVLVDAGRPDRLAAALADTLTNRGPARERACRARRLFLDRFTLDRVGDAMVDFYHRVEGRH